MGLVGIYGLGQWCEYMLARSWGVGDRGPLLVVSSGQEGTHSPSHLLPLPLPLTIQLSQRIFISKWALVSVIIVLFARIIIILSQLPPPSMSLMGREPKRFLRRLFNENIRQEQDLISTPCNPAAVEGAHCQPILFHTWVSRVLISTKFVLCLNENSICNLND